MNRYARKEKDEKEDIGLQNVASRQALKVARYIDALVSVYQLGSQAKHHGQRKKKVFQPLTADQHIAISTTSVL